MEGARSIVRMRRSLHRLDFANRTLSPPRHGAVEEEFHMGINDNNDLNRDPITGTPGAHPVGTGVGAGAGALAGAAIGSVAGPVGTIVGGAVGAIAGGLGGKAVGESVNPTAENAYWQDNYKNEAYVKPDYAYNDYAPAYRAGYENRAKYAGHTFDQAEPDLRHDYEAAKGDSRLGWEEAKHASRAAWQRVDGIRAGDSNGDGF
jgi:hypothetical protein